MLLCVFCISTTMACNKGGGEEVDAFSRLHLGSIFLPPCLPCSPHMRALVLPQKSFLLSPYRTQSHTRIYYKSILYGLGEVGKEKPSCKPRQQQYLVWLLCVPLFSPESTHDRPVLQIVSCANQDSYSADKMVLVAITHKSRPATA